jgi:hypothetical protein
MDCPAGRAGDESFDGEEHRRWNERQREPEDDRVPASRAAGRKELAVLAEQVEERLCDRERAQDEQMQPREWQRLRLCPPAQM